MMMAAKKTKIATKSASVKPKLVPKFEMDLAVAEEHLRRARNGARVHVILIDDSGLHMSSFHASFGHILADLNLALHLRTKEEILGRDR
jgi:hypothetical protein